MLNPKGTKNSSKERGFDNNRVMMNIFSASTGKGCPEAGQKDYKSLADFSSNFTLVLNASLIIFSPHAR